jgi:hypothetical protein
VIKIEVQYQKKKEKKKEKKARNKLNTPFVKKKGEGTWSFKMSHNFETKFEGLIKPYPI